MQRAVQYLRMSTDEQSLSPDLQAAAIAVYAAKHRLQVVETYLDYGRSGLILRNRPAMQRMLQDVAAAPRNFEVILVYDVSRWGRFQNTDASAYYEYECWRHGVSVVYVAEPFAEDDTPYASMFKSIKRSMAAEYSRELGKKSRAGQAKVVQLGFVTGTLPCIGFRRMCVTADGTPKHLLADGERKPMQSDRVKWVAGPDAEVALVRRIFDLYANTPLGIAEIARLLAGEGQVSRTGKRFTQSMVASVLHSPAFIGDIAWGRMQTTANRTRRRARPDRVVRHCGSVPALVELDVWRKTQAKLFSRRRVLRSKDDLLVQLRHALAMNPALIGDEFGAHGCASSTAYENAFGTLSRAYELAGRTRAASLACVKARKDCTRATRQRFQADLVELLRSARFPASHNFKSRHVVVDGLRIAVLVAWQRQQGLRLRWFNQHYPENAADLLLLLRMNEDGTARDFLLYPAGRRTAVPTWLDDRLPESLMRFRVTTAAALLMRIRIELLQRAADRVRCLPRAPRDRLHQDEPGVLGRS